MTCGANTQWAGARRGPTPRHPGSPSRWSGRRGARGARGTRRLMGTQWARAGRRATSSQISMRSRGRTG